MSARRTKSAEHQTSAFDGSDRCASSMSLTRPRRQADSSSNPLCSLRRLRRPGDSQVPEGVRRLGPVTPVEIDEGSGGWARVSHGGHGEHGGMRLVGSDRLQASMDVIDVHRPCPSSFHDGKPTPRATRSAVSPSGSTDGHSWVSEDSGKSLLLRSMKARVAGSGFSRRARRTRRAEVGSE